MPWRQRLPKITLFAHSQNPSSSQSSDLRAQRGSASTEQASSDFLNRGGSTPRTTLDNLPESIELENYPAAASRHDDAARERQRKYDIKRAKKRQWLEARDEMKFSHSIQFNAVPDWSNHYIAYSNLKKL